VARKNAGHCHATAVLFLALAACGGGAGGPDDPFQGRAECASIGGTITEFSDPACTGCRIDNAGHAIDGALGNYATLSVNQLVSGAGPAIRATALEHTPGGAAGAWIHIPQGAQGWTITVRTYLGDTQQESRTLPTTTPTGTPALDTYWSIDTTLAFDAIEVQVSNANVSPADASFRVYEICSDGGVAGDS
jgi:hypothetical protein